MKTINYDQFAGMLKLGKEHPIVINTLPRESFDKEHIPGSISLPASEITRKGEGLFSKNDWIVLHCQGEKCDASEKAARAMEEAGYRNIYRYSGGLDDWKSHGQYVCSEEIKKAA